ncbi:MAG: SGNH/GDSL hydrolase family protein [Cellulosilyticaceae bacterium]
MKKFKKLLVGILVCTSLVSLVGCATDNQKAQENETTGISQIIAFGDSMSDNGGAFKVSKAIVEEGKVEGAYIKPGELYWENRYSNGKTAIEVAAERAQVPLVNYAIGGATSGQANYSDWMDTIQPTGVLGQIDMFKTSLNGEMADQDALYFIFSGANDYCKLVDYGVGGTVEEVADQVIVNIEEAVKTLVEVGAKKFMIPTATDVAAIPYEVRENRAEYATVFVERINTQLPVLVEKLAADLEITIATCDLTSATRKMISNPEEYGFTETTVEAQPTWPEIKPVAENIDEYVFFDEWHFTKAAHEILGEEIYNALTTIQ